VHPHDPTARIINYQNLGSCTLHSAATSLHHPAPNPRRSLAISISHDIQAAPATYLQLNLHILSCTTLTRAYEAKRRFPLAALVHLAGPTPTSSQAAMASPAPGTPIAPQKVDGIVLARKIPSNPTPLSAPQEQQVRDLYYKNVRDKCADEIKGAFYSALLCPEFMARVTKCSAKPGKCKM
jgi:hypothetical protein